MIGVAIMVAGGSLSGMPPAAAIAPPMIDPGALPPDGTPGPPQAMRQTSYCTEVGILPDSDFRIQPKYMNMLNLPEAWKFGRGAGVIVAVIDTGVTPHPRLPNLTGGGDYIMGGGDGLSDCDAHGTLVASLIAAMPDGGIPLPPQQSRRPPSVPTNEPPPPAQTITMVPPTPTPGQEIPHLPGPLREFPAPPADQAPAGPPAPGFDIAPPPEQGGPPPGPPPGPAGASHTGDHPDGARDAIATLPIGYGPRQGPPLAPSDIDDDPSTEPESKGPPPPPPPPAQPRDAFHGIAPDVGLISIRQSSQAFGPKEPFSDGQDPQLREKNNNIRTMARAIVHAANMGASVINISEVVCMNVNTLLDQADLGAAVRYAAVEKNAVIVTAAGDTSRRDCKQNPAYAPLRPDDPRGWDGVNTVVTPAWFSDYVLTVGAVDSAGTPMSKSSVAGPWVSIAAPGTDIEGLSPFDDGLMNAVDGPENSLLVPAGTSFSTAIVSGVVALVRARFPHLSSNQIINRMIHTARPPARGVDNEVGYGIVDPVAALTWDVPDGPVRQPERLSAPLPVPPMPPDRDMMPVWVAGAGLLAVIAAAGVALGAAALRRSLRDAR